MSKGLLTLTTIVAIAISVVVLISGCEKEYSYSTDPVQPQPGPGVTDNVKVTASVSGIVVDENNVPVMGVVVSGGSSTATTNKFGVFRFDNISLAETNGYVKVTKPGYFTGSRSFVTTAGRTHNVRIKLLTKSNTGNFTASAGGAISLTSGAKVTMPANAVTDAAGNAYSGTVNVAMTWIDPTSAELPYRMPGDLRGITTTGDERGLESFGMVGVELTGNGGQALKIAAGKTAELTFPIPSALAASAPATIDLWHFDETTGRWKQEGTATKTGSNYIAQVAHFSFWNVDAPFQTVNLRLTLTNQASGEPLNGVQVRIKRPNGSYAYARTDSSGNVTGLVPSNEALVLELMGQCGTPLASKNIGPFTANTSLGTVAINIPTTSVVTFSGTVKDCSNANVADGEVNIYLAGGYSYNVPVKNGTFSFTTLNCTGNAVSYSILPIDHTARQQGTAVTGSVSGGVVNTGNLLACGTSSQEIIELMIDGSPISFASSTDSLTVYDSTFGASLPAVYPVIKASAGVNPNRREITLSFLSSTGTTGTFPISNIQVRNGTSVAYQANSPNPTVTITELGPNQTGFIAGNFNVTMMFSGTQRLVTGSFRVRRS